MNGCYHDCRKRNASITPSLRANRVTLRQSMSTDRPRSSLAVVLIFGALPLPIAYVLSSGPAVWLFQHGYLTTVLPILYKPLIWLEMSGTPFGQLLGWYW